MDINSKYNKLTKSKVEDLLQRKLTNAEYKEIMQSALYQLLEEKEESNE